MSTLALEVPVRYRLLAVLVLAGCVPAATMAAHRAGEATTKIDFRVGRSHADAFASATAALIDEGFTPATAQPDAGLLVSAPRQIDLGFAYGLGHPGSAGMAQIVVTVATLKEADSTRVVVSGSIQAHGPQGAARSAPEPVNANNSKAWAMLRSLATRINGGVAPDSTGARTPMP